VRTTQNQSTADSSPEEEELRVIKAENMSGDSSKQSDGLIPCNGQTLANKLARQRLIGIFLIQSESLSLIVLPFIIFNP
jgi:hypothetical protein